jgi:hypothetical protein
MLIVEGLSMRGFLLPLIGIVLVMMALRLYAENAGPTRSVPKSDNPPHSYGGGFSPNFNHASWNTPGFSGAGVVSPLFRLSEIYRDPLSGTCYISQWFNYYIDDGYKQYMHRCLECESFSPYDFETYDSSLCRAEGMYRIGGSRVPPEQSRIRIIRKWRDSVTAAVYESYIFKSYAPPGRPGIMSSRRFRLSVTARAGKGTYFGAGIHGNSVAEENQLYVKLSKRIGIRESFVLEKFSSTQLKCDFERDISRDGVFLGVQRDVTEKFTALSFAFLMEYVVCSASDMGSPFYCFLGGGPVFVHETMECKRRNLWETAPEIKTMVMDGKWLCLLSGGVGATLIQIGPINIGFESRIWFTINDDSHEKSVGSDNASLTYGLAVGPRLQW